MIGVPVVNEAEIMGIADGRAAAARFLERLAAPSEPITCRVAIVVAHPDDETIGIGAQLPRLADMSIIHVTDGAPRSMTDARDAGFGTREDYAAARRRELEEATALAGVPGERLLALGMADQEASLVLADLSRRLAALLETLDAEIVLTHPYEGGHPDHDATAFAVHAAVASIERSGGSPPAIVEMASYHEGAEGRVHQRFLPVADRTELVLRLNDGQRALKRRMLDAHASQRTVLVPFATEVERFRRAPHYDFAALPNGGRLLYESHDWGMTGERWLGLATEAMAALRLETRMSP